MPAQPPPFAFGGPELFMVLLAAAIIVAAVGPKFLRERREQRDPL